MATNERSIPIKKLRVGGGVGSKDLRLFLFLSLYCQGTQVSLDLFGKLAWKQPHWPKATLLWHAKHAVRFELTHVDQLVIPECKIRSVCVVCAYHQVECVVSGVFAETVARIHILYRLQNNRNIIHCVIHFYCLLVHTKFNVVFKGEPFCKFEIQTQRNFAHLMCSNRSLTTNKHNVGQHKERYSSLTVSDSHITCFPCTEM